jgi:purine-binding chemotaxis protein CheW
MDIAKIRKKAQEREKDRNEPEKPVPPQEEPGEGARAEGGQKPPVEISLPPASEEEERDVAPADTASVAAPSAVAQILQEEPAAAVTEESSAEAPVEVVELLTFSLSKEEFAFKVPEVEEIIRLQPITRVPAMQEYVLGITSLRGKIIPVIDLKKRIIFRGGRRGDEQSPLEKRKGKEKILILLGPRGPIGVTIDRVMGVVRLPGSKVLEPPAHLLEEERKFVDGVVILEKRFVSIVRCEEALKIEVT